MGRVFKSYKVGTRVYLEDQETGRCSPHGSLTHDITDDSRYIEMILDNGATKVMMGIKENTVWLVFSSIEEDERNCRLLIKDYGGGKTYLHLV
jgi:hypothetical protein